jgi:hypothetical protein
MSYAAGDELPADDVNEIITPGWTTYNPTWTASSGSVSLGTGGTLTGRYRRIDTGPSLGDLVIFEFQLTAGTGATFGTGSWLFTVPFTATALAVAMTAGSCRLSDTGTVSKCAVISFSSTTQILIDSPTGVVTNTVPHTWAATDTVKGQITYEPA